MCSDVYVIRFSLSEAASDKVEIIGIHLGFFSCRSLIFLASLVSFIHLVIYFFRFKLTCGGEVASL